MISGPVNPELDLILLENDFARVKFHLRPLGNEKIYGYDIETMLDLLKLIAPSKGANPPRLKAGTFKVSKNGIKYARGSIEFQPIIIPEPPKPRVSMGDRLGILPI